MKENTFTPYLVGRRKNILVVDDSRAVCLLVSRFLEKLGFTIFTASDGYEALKVLYTEDIPIVITDWEMPHMNGVQLCAEIRNRFPENRHYILMLTANDQRDAIKMVFEAGADDFLTKPIDNTALRARLHGGIRIVAWQDDLAWLHKELEEKQAQLNRRFSKIRDDLVVAEAMQRRHIPPSEIELKELYVCSVFEPAFHTSGDMYNFVKLSEHEIGAFSVDVSGHGIASSLLAVAIAESLCVRGEAQSVLLDGEGNRAREPNAVVSDLNSRFNNISTDHYFTITYCVLDTKTKKLKFCQAGHPPILHIFADGRAEEIGDGGIPVGMFEDVEYDSSEIQLETGSRIYMFSDGIPEAENIQSEQYGCEQMTTCLQQSLETPLSVSLENLLSSARDWRSNKDFSDDVSILAFELLQ